MLAKSIGRWLAMAMLFGAMMAHPARAALLVASAGSNSVKQYDSAGAYLGDLFTSGGGSGITGLHSIAIGPDGNLYAANWNNSFGLAGGIYRFNAVTGAYISTFVTPGSGGLSSAYDFTWRTDGNLYVSDYWNSKVLKYDGATGNLLGTFIGGGLANPEGLVFTPDGQYLLVANRGTSSVLKFDAATGAYIGVFGQANFADSDLHEASSLRYGPDGNLYVVDQNNASNVVKRYDGATGAYLGGFLSGGPGVTNSADGLFDTDGKYYLAHYNTIEQYSSTGVHLGTFISSGLNGGIWLAVVPEPAAASFALIGAAGLLLGRRNRTSRQ